VVGVWSKKIESYGLHMKLACAYKTKMDEVQLLRVVLQAFTVVLIFDEFHPGRPLRYLLLASIGRVVLLGKSELGPHGHILIRK